MYEFLDKRYALALYKVAEDKNKVLEYIEDLKAICDIIDNDKDFQKIIAHPQISSKKKRESFIEIFKDKIDDELLSFLILLIKKDRILFLKEKVKEMENIHLERNNTIRGVVKTTFKLEKDEYDTLVNKLEAKYNKKVILDEVLDEQILGGIWLMLNNEVYDYTIKSELIKIKSLILKDK